MRATLVGVVALGLVVVACGDDGDAQSPATQAFCDSFEALDEEFGNVDPTGDAEAFARAVEALRDIEPPQEIADDYDLVVEGFEALSKIDLTDPDAVADFQERYEGAEDAFTTVERFVTEECGS